MKFRGMELTPNMSMEDMAENFESSVVRPIYPVIREFDTMPDDTRAALTTALLVAIVDSMKPSNSMLDKMDKTEMPLDRLQVIGTALALAINEKVAMNVPVVVSEFTQLCVYKMRMMSGDIPLHDIALNISSMVSPAMAKRLSRGDALEFYNDIRSALRR